MPFKARAEYFSKSSRLAGFLWIMYFSYATCAALLFQKIILPLLPSMQSAHGLLNADSLYFHQSAIKLADVIHQYGWSAWSLRPIAGDSGTIGLLGALYALFGPDPVLMIPINAAVHALSGLMLYWLAENIWPGRIGRTAGLITGCLFVFFPSAINWYGQIHKDGFTSLGLLMMFYGGVIWLGADSKKLFGWRALLWALVGILLFSAVRPHYLRIMGWGIAFFLILYGAFGMRRDQWRVNILRAFGLLVVCVVMLGSARYIEPAKSAAKSYMNGESLTVANLHWEFQASDGPKFLRGIVRAVDNHLESIVRIRLGLIEHGKAVQAQSVIDADVIPNSAMEVIQYLPRAFTVALFAPFPTDWFRVISPTRMVAVMETTIFYLTFCGFVLGFRRSQLPALLFLLCIGISTLTLFGVTIANLGSLYRIRYPFMFIFIMIGVAGWLSWLGKYREKAKDPLYSPESASPQTLSPANQRVRVANSGFMVIAATLAMYAGLFMRDVYMARWFGLGQTLDNFYLAMIVPMLMVTLLSIPYGAALIPEILKARERGGMDAIQRLISFNIALTGLILAAICLVLWASAPYLMKWIDARVTSGASETIFLMVLGLPILLFSAWVIIGNSFLNAFGEYALPSLAQLTVPLCAILALLLGGHVFGIASVVAGIGIGQLFNLAILMITCRRKGLRLWPSWQTSGITEAYLAVKRFWPLAVAAACMGLTLPFANALATSLPEGSIGALNLGTKVVIFATGLLGTGIATVMLPYFSFFMVRNHWIEARNELAFFLLSANLLAAPASILIYWSAPWLVDILFQGGAFKLGDAEVLKNVIQYGVIQLPFFVANMLLGKFATAAGQNRAILISAAAGLTVSVIMSWVLMRYFGVGGIALALTGGVLCSAASLLVMIHRVGHVDWFTIVFLFVGWLLYLTFLLCIHYGSYPGAVAAVLAYLAMLPGHFLVLFPDRPETTG